MKQPKQGRTIYLHKDEPIDSALKRLKDRLEINGILDDIKQHARFENDKKKAQRKKRTQKQRWSREWHYDKREELYLNEH